MPDDETTWTFSDWAENYPLGEPWDPPCDDVITAGTAFVMVTTTSPLPMAAYSEGWQWTLDQRLSLAFLRHVTLPSLIATWFFEQYEGDRLPSREYLDQARATGSFLKDIPVVEGVLDAVEGIDPDGDRAVVLAGLQDAARLWNDRFARTGTWDLGFHVYADARSAADAYWNLHFDGGYPPTYQDKELDREGWVRLVLSAENDQAANDYAVEQFNDVYS